MNSYPMRIPNQKSSQQQKKSSFSPDQNPKKLKDKPMREEIKNNDYSIFYINETSKQTYQNHSNTQLQLQARKIIRQFYKLNQKNTNKSKINSDSNKTDIVQAKKSIEQKLTKVYKNILKIVYEVLVQKFVKEVADQLVYIINTLVYFYEEQDLCHNLGNLSNQPQIKNINQINIENMKIGGNLNEDTFIEGKKIINKPNVKKQKVLEDQLTGKNMVIRQKFKQSQTMNIRREENGLDKQMSNEKPSYHMPKLSVSNLKVSLNSPSSNSNQISPQPSARTYTYTQIQTQTGTDLEKNKTQTKPQNLEQQRPNLRILVLHKLRSQYTKLKSQKQKFNKQIEQVNKRILQAYETIQQKIHQNQMNTIIAANRSKNQKNKTIIKNKNGQDKRGSLDVKALGFRDKQNIK